MSEDANRSARFSVGFDLTVFLNHKDDFVGPFHCVRSSIRVEHGTLEQLYYRQLYTTIAHALLDACDYATDNGP